MSWEETSESVCQIACALALVGDRWTLLIMREISMGVKRFEDLQMQTGMSSHLLALRLKRMEEDGLLVRRPYRERPPRFEYDSTRKGQELDAVLLALRNWGLHWEVSSLGDTPSISMTDKASGGNIDGNWQIPQSGRPFTFNDVEIALHPTFVAERQTRTDAFHAKKLRKATRTKR
jgi:DNA-binding HxlR family transcriptional regulator